MKIAFYGSSLLSAYWNGAATYYRGMLRALSAKGYDITFYEPDAFQRQEHRDIPDPAWARVVVYPSEGLAGVTGALAEAERQDRSGMRPGGGDQSVAMRTVERDERRAAFRNRVRPRGLDRLALHAAAAVERALERVELTDYADRQIGQLSGGQRKRAFVARGLAQDASVLLLDEPFAGVDKASEATIVRLLRQLADDGRTVLVSTHDLHALPELADEAILLMRRVLFHGPVAEALRPERLAMAFGLDPTTPPATPDRIETP